MQKRVLIVNEDCHFRDELAKMVHEVKPDSIVWEASDSADAYQCAMEHTIDVFIVDVVLDTGQRGDVSGLIFIKNIRNYNKYYFTPVIVITYAEDSTNYLYHEMHCFDYIERPYDSARVRSALKSAL